MNWINQMETAVKLEIPVRKEEDLKKPKASQSEKEKEEKKVVKTVVCVDHDSEESDEYYYDMSDSEGDGLEDILNECKDELWKIE